MSILSYNQRMYEEAYGLWNQLKRKSNFLVLNVKKNKQKRSLKTHIDSAHENIMYASIKLPKKEKRRN